MTEPARRVEERLGAVERHSNSNDQRLTKLEGLYESLHTGITNILAFQQVHSERLALMDERFTQRFDNLENRFDNLEKVVVEIRDSRNGSQP